MRGNWYNVSLTSLYGLTLLSAAVRYCYEWDEMRSSHEGTTYPLVYKRASDHVTFTCCPIPGPAIITGTGKRSKCVCAEGIYTASTEPPGPNTFVDI